MNLFSKAHFFAKDLSTHESKLCRDRKTEKNNSAGKKPKKKKNIRPTESKTLFKKFFLIQKQKMERLSPICFNEA